MSLFRNLGPRKKYDDRFVAIRDGLGYLPARAMMDEAFERLTDPDGNFLEQLQTAGFDPRTWELYLNETFISLDFVVERPHPHPDFLIYRAQQPEFKVAIEAVTTNPVGNIPPSPDPEKLKPIPDIWKFRDEAKRKLDKVLRDKLEKKYWETPSLQGVPLVIAVESFHDIDALALSSNTILDYLFDCMPYLGERDPRVEHGLFLNNENAKYISAVLFSNSGTISKFGRMGLQKGHGQGQVQMQRMVRICDETPGATEHLEEVIPVGDGDYEEDWAEGLSLIHNPRAIHPIPHDYFDALTYHYHDGEKVVTMLYGLSPISQKTLIFTTAESSTEVIEQADSEEVNSYIDFNAVEIEGGWAFQVKALDRDEQTEWTGTLSAILSPIQKTLSELPSGKELKHVCQFCLLEFVKRNPTFDVDEGELVVSADTYGTAAHAGLILKVKFEATLETAPAPGTFTRIWLANVLQAIRQWMG